MCGGGGSGGGGEGGGGGGGERVQIGPRAYGMDQMVDAGLRLQNYGWSEDDSFEAVEAYRASNGDRYAYQERLARRGVTTNMVTSKVSDSFRIIQRVHNEALRREQAAEELRTNPGTARRRAARAARRQAPLRTNVSLGGVRFEI